MDIPEQRGSYDRGMETLRKLSGEQEPTVLRGLFEVAPDLARLTVEFPYGEVHSRPALDLRDRQLAAIGALTALGHCGPQLRFHIAGALNIGCGRREVIEAIMHVVPYAGFLVAINALEEAKTVFAAHEDPTKDEPRPQDASESRYERGWKALREVDGPAGEAVIASLEGIAPDLARYVIEFTFGDIYVRPGLDLRAREIVTVAACTALGSVLPQLKVHVHGLLNVGGTREEVVETITQTAVYAGFPVAINAMHAASEVFAARG